MGLPGSDMQRSPIAERCGMFIKTKDGVDADSGPLTAKLLKNGTLKTYKGFPHGMPTTQAETINADLLAFIKS